MLWLCYVTVCVRRHTIISISPGPSRLAAFEFDFEATPPLISLMGSDAIFMIYCVFCSQCIGPWLGLLSTVRITQDDLLVASLRFVSKVMKLCHLL